MFKHFYSSQNKYLLRYMGEKPATMLSTYLIVPKIKAMKYRHREEYYAH